MTTIMFIDNSAGTPKLHDYMPQCAIFYSLPRLLPRGFLLAGLKGAGQCNSPRAVPPVPAPRFPQLRPSQPQLSVA